LPCGLTVSPMRSPAGPTVRATVAVIPQGTARVSREKAPCVQRARPRREAGGADGVEEPDIGVALHRAKDRASVSHRHTVGSKAENGVVAFIQGERDAILVRQEEREKHRGEAGPRAGRIGLCTAP
jgi:hypothetical protein